MGLPMTSDGQTEWLINAVDPRLDPERLAAIADPRRPDRLAWNAFRVLALWSPDTWAPALAEMACGAGSPLVDADWTGATVTHWTSDVLGPDVCDVVVEGPAAHLVLACTLRPDPPRTALRAAAVAAVDGSLEGGGRLAGLVVVGPPGSPELVDRMTDAGDVEVHGGRLLADLFDGTAGAASWIDLGRLALDLAEEAAEEPKEQVRRLVAQVQAYFPDSVL